MAGRYKFSEVELEEIRVARQRNRSYYRFPSGTHHNADSEVVSRNKCSEKTSKRVNFKITERNNPVEG